LLLDALGRHTGQILDARQDFGGGQGGKPGKGENPSLVETPLDGRPNAVYERQIVGCGRAGGLTRWYENRLT
jgi:hypothetical protein